MLNYTFESGISGHIAGLIEQKRSNGFAYDSGEKLLKRFDGFCTEKYPSAVTVTEELAQEWCRLRPGQGAAYHNNKITILRQLGFYIQSLGLQAYIPHSFCKTYKPILYIPSGEEIRALLHNGNITAILEQRNPTS